MQRQYHEMKQEVGEAILLFRLGDFYEMFYDDAIESSKLLGLTLTARGKGSDNEMPMCGMPYHASEKYINALSQAGKKVAICDQVSDPTLPGIVKREIVQIITPGTILSGQIQDEKSSNYICAVSEKNNVFGLASMDVSTGEFRACFLPRFEDLMNELSKISPSEIILNKKSLIIQDCETVSQHISFWFSLPNPEEFVKKFFSLPNLSLFYLENEPEVVSAAAMLIDYVNDTQKGKTNHITSITKYNITDTLPIDMMTLRNLEVFQTMHEGKKDGSLLSVIDKTQSAAGGRMLKQILLNPLQNLEKIKERLNQVKKYKTKNSERNILQALLSEIYDIERILSKISSGRANPKDILALNESFKKIPEIQKLSHNILSS